MLAAGSARRLPPARVPAAGWGALAAGMLAAAAAAGRPVLLVGVAVVQAGLGWGWLRRAAVGPRMQSAAIVGAVAVAGDLLVVTRPANGLARLAGLIGLAFVATVLDQLLRRDRGQLTDSLMHTMSAAVLVMMIATPLALPRGGTAGAVLIAGFVGIAAALVLAVVARSRSALVIGVVGVLAGGTGGAAYGLIAADGSAGGGLAVGLGTGALAVVGWLTARSARSVPAEALLPLALAAPAGYVAGRLLGG